MTREERWLAIIVILVWILAYGVSVANERLVAMPVPPGDVSKD